MPTNQYLASKPRYEILDGLRGVAALTVIIFHLFETYSKGPVFQIVNHGYLAVDFFFVLSGFVVGYAYDDRWDKMSIGSFFKRRLIRLHPMVVVSTLIGASFFYLQDCDAFSNISQTGAGKFLLCILLGILMIPAGKNMDIRGWGEINGFNGPNWTLTYEYVANILYAFFFRHLGKVSLAILVGLCAILTLNLTLNWDIFGLWVDRTAQAYTVIGGWSLTAPQILIGFTRLLYPFLCGLLLSRIGKYITVKGGFWWCSLLLLVVLCTPYMGDSINIRDGIYNAACILLIFPLMVMIGAGSRISGKFSTKVCKFLGDISYPVYIVHYPFIYLQVAWVRHNPEAPLYQHVCVGAGVFFFSVLLAYSLLKSYDEPVREWLKNKLFKTVKQTEKR